MNKRLSSTIAALLLLCVLATPLQAAPRGVVLNFSDVDISTMVKFISDLTGRNFVMDDRVKGKISVFSPTKLSIDEAFSVFTSVLELKGFTVIHAGKVYKIVPTAIAKQEGMKVFTDLERGPVNDGYVARVISLDHIAANEAVAFLQPVVSKDGYISSFGPANMLLVVDSALNIQKILGIIDLIDMDQPREKAEVVFLKNASAESAAKIVQEWLKSRDKSARGPAPQAAPSAAAGIIVPDTRLNALIVFGSDQDKEDVKKLDALIDVVPPSTSIKVNVYYLENADATDLAKVLDGVVKGSIAAPTATGGPGAGTAAPQQSPFEGGKITITPDKATNSLVIMASPNDYQNLSQVIQKLDKRRRQVFVEAVIAEITPSKIKDLGLQWGMLGAATDGKYVSVLGEYDPQGAITKLLADIASSGAASFITIPNSGTPMNFAAVLKALDNRGAVNVLSSPTILTSDNKEAEIFVGQNVPFVTSSTSYNTGVAQTSNIERKDTGITLKITPQISEGDSVKLDIYQEISAVTGDKGQATDLVTTKRSAKTSVVVKDRETVVIGGLIQDQENETVNKVPFLGDIPGLGWLFKSVHKDRTKTNLLIVLTPRIIRGGEEMTEVTKTQKQKFNEAIKMDKPFSLDEQAPLKP